MKPWKTEIDRWLSGREALLVERIGELVAVPSVGGEPEGPEKPFGAGPARALEVAAAQAEAAGLRPENVDGYVLTADLNDCPDRLHILAHLDVVAPGEGWDSDPYTIRREGDLLYGRGVDDDKGPAAAAMLAMECVKALGIPLKGNAKLILGTDEETGSRDIAYYYARHPYAPCAVSPDAQFPVINIEKGRYAPVLARSWEAETATPRVTALAGGIRVNVAPRLAQAEILGLAPCGIAPLAELASRRTGTELRVVGREDGCTVTCTGQEAHASTPEEGVNAITALLSFLGELPLADTASTRALKGLAELFPHGDHHGTALGIDRTEEKSGRMTVCLSLLELDGTGFHAQFDARTPLGATEEACVAAVEERCRARNFSVAGAWKDPHQVPEESPFVETLLRCYEECTGKPGRCVSMGGGTYVHDIPGGVAFGAGDFDFDSRLHSANERVRVSALLETAKIYANVIVELCGA